MTALRFEPISEEHIHGPDPEDKEFLRFAYDLGPSTIRPQGQPYG